MTQAENVGPVGAEHVPLDLVMAFAPLHKRAFGLAVGMTLGSLVLVATLAEVLRGGRHALLPLLSNYFPGYSVSWEGALVGFAWTAFATFVAGWFVAFMRNFVLAASLWLVRTRAELEATRDFLDHI